MIFVIVILVYSHSSIVYRLTMENKNHQVWMWIKDWKLLFGQGQIVNIFDSASHTVLVETFILDVIGIDGSKWMDRAMFQWNLICESRCTVTCQPVTGILTMQTAHGLGMPVAGNVLSDTFKGRRTCIQLFISSLGVRTPLKEDLSRLPMFCGPTWVIVSSLNHSLTVRWSHCDCPRHMRSRVVGDRPASLYHVAMLMKAYASESRTIQLYVECLLLLRCHRKDSLTSVRLILRLVLNYYSYKSICVEYRDFGWADLISVVKLNVFHMPFKAAPFGPHG